MKAGAGGLRPRIAAPHLVERRLEGGYIDAFARPLRRVSWATSLALSLPVLKEQVTSEQREQRRKHELLDVFCSRHSLARFQEGLDNINCLHLIHH